MGTLMGFVVGYSLGAKAGPEGFEKLKKAFRTVVESPELRTMLAAVTEQATRDGGLREAWHMISESEGWKNLVNSGLTMVGGAIERGRAVVESRRH